MTRMSRTLLAPLAVLALALALFATPALATQTGTTGYYNTPPKPAPTSTTGPASGTGPSRETSKPRTTSSSPSGASTTPTASTPTSTTGTSSHSTLPFTGLDLRWVLGIGLVLIGAGVSIRMTQRRQREGL